VLCFSFSQKMAELRLGADARAPNPGYLKLLVEFGYPHDLACTALLNVKNESLESAIDWLDRNRDALDAAQAQETDHRPVIAGAPVAAPVQPAHTTPEAMLNSDLRPDGLSRSKLEAERKAHADYKRQKQAQEERELLKKKEADSKEVRERYARERAAKAAQKSAAPAGAAGAPAPVAAAPVAAAPRAAANPNAEVVIQVRVPNRPPVTIKGLTGSASLAELYARVDAECGRSDFVLTQPFPPPVTHLPRGAERTLAELGLAPRAALTVTDMASLGKVSQGVGAPPAAAPHPGGFGGGGLPMGPPVPMGGGGGRGRPGPAPAAAVGVAHKYRGQPQNCLVCQSQLEAEQDARTLGCGHVFHDECMEEWMAENDNTCPGCGGQ
jgi:hypothetical protein